jgi:hypothetical protein
MPVETSTDGIRISVEDRGRLSRFLVVLRYRGALTAPGAKLSIDSKSNGASPLQIHQKTGVSRQYACRLIAEDADPN